jgi:hypothetical protein
MRKTRFVPQRLQRSAPRRSLTIVPLVLNSDTGGVADIDVQATLESKIGVEMPRYRILGACNPELAREALKFENKVGVLLPCNVIVRETSDKGIEVAALDPVCSLERSGGILIRINTYFAAGTPGLVLEQSCLLSRVIRVTAAFRNCVID